MNEEKVRKYERKLDELRAKYEKLVKVVRLEERASYQQELKKLFEEN